MKNQDKIREAERIIREACDEAKAASFGFTDVEFANEW